MGRTRTGSIFKRKGKLIARITYVGTDGKRHAIWRTAKNRTHAKQLLVEIANLLGTDIKARHETSRRTHGFIYALRMESPDRERPIKIGYSARPQERVADLACGSPYPITLLGFWETGNADIEERRIHAEFAGDRLQGEWFRPAPALLELVTARVAAYRGKLAARAAELESCCVL